MKMMNDMELDQVTGGRMDIKGKVFEEEKETFTEMYNRVCDVLSNGYSVVKHIFFK